MRKDTHNCVVTLSSPAGSFSMGNGVETKRIKRQNGVEAGGIFKSSKVTKTLGRQGETL